MHEQFILPEYKNCLNDILAAVFNTVGEAIVVANDEGEVVMLNNHVLEIWGYEADDLLGKPLSLLMPEQYREMHDKGMQRYIETGQQKVLNNRLELEALRANGKAFPIQLYIAETHFEGYRLFTAAIRDITEIVDARKKLEQTQQELLQANNLIKAQNDELAEEVRLDPLTRILNHVALKERISEEIDHLSRSNRPFSLLFFDIDDFKKLNDETGHLHGDSCLRDLTELVNNRIIRKVDTFGRYGGEEFIVIMPGIDAEGALIAGERLRKTIETADWQYQALTVTIGAVTVDEIMSLDTIVERADQAMYYGKRQGKNQVNHWNKLQSD
jgi:diguanylate cyclase (GGDEF)-like protein/PAS domain S-box-containing protein